jgi:hypothetical protein
MNDRVMSCADTDLDLSVPIGILATDLEKVSVSYGQIDNCDVGVSVSGAKSKFKRVNVNFAAGHGFHVTTTATGTKLQECSSQDSGTSGYQIDADRVSIKDSFASGSGGIGFAVDGSEAKVLGSYASASPVGFRTPVDGVTKLLKSNSLGNVLGFEIRGNDIVIKSRAVGSDQDGFLVSASAKLVKNVAEGNPGNGVRVISDAADTPKFVNNSFGGNATDHGFDVNETVSGCGSHVWINNEFITASEPCVE